MKAFIIKLSHVLQSKTFWLIAITFLLNGIAPIRALIDPQYLPFVDAGLALLATLTHIFPQRDYSAPVIPTSEFAQDQETV